MMPSAMCLLIMPDICLITFFSLTACEMAASTAGKKSYLRYIAMISVAIPLCILYWVLAILRFIIFRQINLVATIGGLRKYRLLRVYFGNIGLVIIIAFNDSQ